MVDIQDRRFLAQCTQQLSSNNLSALLDLLLLHHPDEVVERKGGDSYHIDFGTMSPAAYELASKFIRQAVRDDEVEASLTRQDSLPLLPMTSDNSIDGFRQASFSSLGLPLGQDSSELLMKENSLMSLPDLSSYTTAPLSPREKIPEVEVKKPVETTPVLPLPSNPSAVASVDSITVTPEKRGSRLTRKRRSSDSREPTPEPVSSESDDGERQSVSTAGRGPKKQKKKPIENRYYNGERIWRMANENKEFEFHGVKVKLLGHHTKTAKPWVCSICSKSFVSKDKIVNHVQQHSGEKLHECPICHGKFSSKHYLKEHEKRVHQFDCHHCDEIFSTFDDLHQHVIEEHPGMNVDKCACTKGCANSRCTCFKNGLNCRDTCQCHNCNNHA